MAEVLITLAIIGVVAAITLPTLYQNNLEKQRVSQLKKVYSALTQAYTMAVNEYGAPSTWGMGGMYDENSHYIFASNMKKFLKLSVDCVDMTQTKAQQACGSDVKDRNHYDNNTMASLSSFRNARQVVLSDGTQVAFRVYDGVCPLNYGAIKNVCGTISVDLNGKKLPNYNGKDQFKFFMTNEKIVPYGIKNSPYTFEQGCNRQIETPYPVYSAGHMYTCTAWVLYNENQDYLHCDDLSWDGKHKCK